MPPLSYVVTPPGGCQVNVIYTTRLACGFWNDMQIPAIDQIAPFDESCVSYAAMDTKDFLALITEDVLEAKSDGPPRRRRPSPGKPRIAPATGG